jgi:hypothetical protein
MDGMRILREVMTEWSVRVWTDIVQPKTGTGGGVVPTRKPTTNVRIGRAFLDGTSD